MAPPPWNDDNQDGESSLQLLVGWLISGQNYERWLQGDASTREAICDEIVSLFKVRGIAHRTSAGIKMKISSMETAVLHAQSVLRENGYVDLTNLDEADMSLMCDILGRYPTFDFVAPLMAVMPSEGLAHKPVVSRSLRWDADRSLERTTMDVLLDWVTTASNYERWRHKTAKRAAICFEINKLLHERAIHNRSITGIVTRIGLLERSMKRAVSVLDRCGITGSIKLDACDEVVKNEISQCCRHFEQLAPVMMACENAETREQIQSTTQSQENESAREESMGPEQNPDQFEGRLDQNSRAEVREIEQEEKSSEASTLEIERVAQAENAAMVRWQRVLNAPAAPPGFETREVDNSTTEGRQIITSDMHGSPSVNARDQTSTQSTENEYAEDEGFEIVEVRRNGVVVSEGSPSTTCLDEHCLRRQWLEELELEHKRAEYEHESKKRKIQLSVEEKLARQRLVVETELARHKLLQAGLSGDYVAQVLPSCR